MATKKKLLQAAAGNAGGAALNVEDVFSTYLYEGNESTQTITNGIDLDGEGGMVWIKRRNLAERHAVFDSERSLNSVLATNEDSQARIRSGWMSSFNANGFTLNTGDTEVNNNGDTYASWTFRKAPKFFDVVTWTGDGTNNRKIPHNLGSEVGCYFVKQVNDGRGWSAYHRGVNGGTNPEQYIMVPSGTDAQNNVTYWNDTAPTSTEFTINSSTPINESGGTYIAYLWAHNDGDGEFGPDADQDIIKCGSFTTNANGDASIDLGFEPQWVLLKRTDAAQSWWLADTMRGMTVGTTGTAYLFPDQSAAEDSTYTNYINPTSTGFGVDAFSGSASYIYIAIRRPTAVPESATEVFAVTTQSGSTPPAHDTGFVTDFSLRRENALSSASVIQAVDRLRGKPYLVTDGTNSETNLNNNTWDFMDGWFGATSDDSNKYAWSWKRAPNYFDVVAYTGDQQAGRNIIHNLTVPPEMMWVKQRSEVRDWTVYHKGSDATAPETKYLKLNATDSVATTGDRWNETAPTSSVFTVGSSSRTNKSNHTYIAYLFSTLAGISKVGSATHSGTTNVDCGFSAGSRFVLLKRTDASGDWYVWDSVRGIVSGNDPYLLLNTTAAEVTNTDLIDPLSSGFTITSSLTAGNYIFYAIA